MLLTSETSRKESGLPCTHGWIRTCRIYRPATRRGQRASINVQSNQIELAISHRPESPPDSRVQLEACMPCSSCCMHVMCMHACTILVMLDMALDQSNKPPLTQRIELIHVSHVLATLNLTARAPAQPLGSENLRVPAHCSSRKSDMDLMYMPSNLDA